MTITIDDTFLDEPQARDYVGKPSEENVSVENMKLLVNVASGETYANTELDKSQCVISFKYYEKARSIFLQFLSAHYALKFEEDGINVYEKIMNFLKTDLESFKKLLLSENLITDSSKTNKHSKVIEYKSFPLNPNATENVDLVRLKGKDTIELYLGSENYYQGSDLN